MAQRGAQQGLSLLELLVGMVLSLIIVLAMLSVFKTTARTTAESSAGAQIDGQIAAGLLTADRLLQGAGFGYASGTSVYSTAFQVYASGSAVSVGTKGNAIVWMSSSTTCQAIVASGASLTFYGPASSGYSCSALALPGSNSSSQTLIVSPAVTIPIAASAGVTSIIVNNSSCTPYGTGTINASGYASGGYTVTLSTVAYAASATLQSQTCLVNFH